jgi:hypothetical protein
LAALQGTIDLPRSVIGVVDFFELARFAFVELARFAARMDSLRFL